MTSAKSFRRDLQIHFRDADPAKIVYFAHLFSFAHDTFESFIVDAGIPWRAWFIDNSHFVPIRHAECDYLAPFFPGENYQIEAQVESLGASSFKMKYTFSRQSQIHAIVRMVHTFADPKTKQKVSLPEEIRQKLTPYQVEAKA